VLIGVDFLAGPLSGHMLGLVTLETGQVTPVPVNITPGTQLFGGAVAVDATGTLAYYAGIETNMTFASVFRVPLPGGGPPVRVAMLRVRNVSGFAWDNAGKLLVSSSNTPSLYSVDVGSGSVTTINNFSAGGWFRGMAYEAATGHFAVLSDVNSAAFPFSVSPTGTVFPLAAAPVPGTGHAIAVLPDPVAYGAGNPGGNAYSWALAPNPGGLPTAGNAGFSLTVRSTPSPAPGFFALSLAPDALPVGRITFLVNLGALVLLAPLANATENTIPLSIPEGPLLGVSVYGQAIFTEPGLVAASPGVQVTIL
jgi:hypothetical protein